MWSLHVFTFNPFQENTYVLANDMHKAIIIDPGMYFQEEKDKLNKFLFDKGLEPVQVILTHAHLDHVFGLEYVCKLYNLVPFLHINEKIVLDNAEMAGNKYGLSFDSYKGALNYIDEKDIITLGDDKLSIIFAPGHSPGSIGFYSEKQQFLIGGDVLFHESIGRTDLPLGNQEQLLKSIQDKVLILPENTTVFSGHGISTTIGHEKKHNPFLR